LHPLFHEIIGGRPGDYIGDQDPQQKASGLNSDNVGRIYVRMFKLYNPNDRSEKFDVFCQKGYYIYRTNLPLFPNIIKNGYIYNIEFNQDTGYSKIKRYKIKNWEQIKTGINWPTPHGSQRAWWWEKNSINSIPMGNNLL
jgi:hypothetical protein